MNAVIPIQNRNEAFHLKVDDLGLRRKTVYKLIETYGPITSQEVKEKMRLGVNQVSGRVTELAARFFIKAEGSKVNNKSNCSNTLWVVTTPNERINLINAEFIHLRNERDELVNDLNLTELSEVAKEIVRKRVAKIDAKIETLEKL